MKAGMVKIACSFAGVSFNCAAAGASLSPLGLITVAAVVVPAVCSMAQNKELLGKAKALLTSKWGDIEVPIFNVFVLLPLD